MVSPRLRYLKEGEQALGYKGKNNKKQKPVKGKAASKQAKERHNHIVEKIKEG